MITETALRTMEKFNLSVPQVTAEQEILLQVGLEDYQIDHSSDTLHLVDQVLMNNQIPNYAKSTIKTFLKFVVPVRHRFDASAFSSTSFYELPFHAFISEFGAQVMAPDLLLPEKNIFILADNLYHEALHQKLIQRLEEQPHFEAHLLKNAAQYQIYVRWRDVHWSTEHTLQALYVYVHLRKFRNDLSSALEECASFFSEGAFVAEKSAIYLYEQMASLEMAFTQAGQNLLNEIREMVDVR